MTTINAVMHIVDSVDITKDDATTLFAKHIRDNTILTFREYAFARLELRIHFEKIKNEIETEIGHKGASCIPPDEYDFCKRNARELYFARFVEHVNLLIKPSEDLLYDELTPTTLLRNETKFAMIILQLFCVLKCHKQELNYFPNSRKIINSIINREGLAHEVSSVESEKLQETQPIAQVEEKRDATQNAQPIAQIEQKSELISTEPISHDKQFATGEKRRAQIKEAVKRHRERVAQIKKDEEIPLELKLKRNKYDEQKECDIAKKLKYKKYNAKRRV